MTAGAPVIRPGGPADLAAVARIERESFTDPWSDSTLLSELQPSLLRTPLVAEQDGQLAGYLMAWVVRDELHVLNLAVARRARRRGVGRLLMEAALELARREGLAVVTLEVRISNSGARAFYEQLGFRDAGIRQGYYPDTGEDALVMALLLPPPAATGR